MPLDIYVFILLNLILFEYVCLCVFELVGCFRVLKDNKGGNLYLSVCECSLFSVHTHVSMSYYFAFFQIF